MFVEHRSLWITASRQNPACAYRSLYFGRSQRFLRSIDMPACQGRGNFPIMTFRKRDAQVSRCSHGIDINPPRFWGRSDSTFDTDAVPRSSFTMKLLQRKIINDVVSPALRGSVFGQRQQYWPMTAMLTAPQFWQARQLLRHGALTLASTNLRALWYCGYSHGLKLRKQ
jgi:hypothetical protein